MPEHGRQRGNNDDDGEDLEEEERRGRGAEQLARSLVIADIAEDEIGAVAGRLLQAIDDDVRLKENVPQRRETEQEQRENKLQGGGAENQFPWKQPALF